jgi:hypothetical protein
MGVVARRRRAWAWSLALSLGLGPVSVLVSWSRLGLEWCGLGLAWFRFGLALVWSGLRFVGPQFGLVLVWFWSGFGLGLFLVGLPLDRGLLPPLVAEGFSYPFRSVLKFYSCL